jgi:CheY-like chemotaxis protein
MEVLYVDNDAEDREIFSEALKVVRPSVACVFAFNGVEAIIRLHGTSLPDYIFLDINMPIMDGRECLKVIKTNPRLYHIPVFMYSTSNDEDDVEECLKMGANAYMVKPRTFKKLCDTISSVIIQPVKETIAIR